MPANAEGDPTRYAADVHDPFAIFGLGCQHATQARQRARFYAHALTHREVGNSRPLFPDWVSLVFATSSV